jgi:enamine deaminase RidA (YjgF/YER057c/UK114 family)
VSAPLFEPVVLVDDVVYVSGQIATDEDGVLVAEGRVGAEVDVETATRCAEACARNLLARLADVPGGLDGIDRLVKLTVFVAVAPGFDEPHVVANGASQLLLRELGERGRHGRSAIGVAALPRNSPVEVEAIARLLRDRDA